MAKQKQKPTEKIELKHLAPYLPFGLKMCNYEKKLEFLLLSLSPNSDIDIISTDEVYDGENGKGTNLYYFDRQQFYPILKPLSQLTEQEVAKVEIALGGLSNFGILTRIQQEVLFYSNYNMIEYLLSNHYDIFGLIEKGLAVDAKTL